MTFVEGPTAEYNAPKAVLFWPTLKTKMILTKTVDPWSVARTKRTLESLGKEFPGYTNNELYSIWCYQNGRIPLDRNQKVELDTWQLQAEVDGEALGEGGFRVSRALYGRAMKAKSGVAKPKRALRAASENGRAHKTAPNGISERAMSLAERFDRGLACAAELVELQSKQNSLLKELGSLPTSMLEEIAKESPSIQHLLRELGNG